MSIEWSLDRSTVHTTKLLKFGSIEGFQLQWLRKNVYLAPTLRREKKLLPDWVFRPCQKSNMLMWVRGCCQLTPSEAYLATMLWVVIVLLQKYDN